MSLFYFAILGLIANSMSTLKWNVCLAKIVRFFFFPMKSLLLGPCKALLKLSWYTYVLYICLYIYVRIYIFPCSVKIVYSPSFAKLFSEVTEHIFQTEIVFIRCHGQESKEQNRLDSWCTQAGVLLYPPRAFMLRKDGCGWTCPHIMTGHANSHVFLLIPPSSKWPPGLK